MHAHKQSGNLLLIAMSILLAQSGCYFARGPAVDPDDPPIPVTMTAQNFQSTEPDALVGHRVVLEGRVSGNLESGYFLRRIDETPIKGESGDRHIQLVFELDNLANSQMAKCDGQVSFVTGYVTDGYRISVEFVSLKSDTSRWSSAECYRPWH